MTPVTLARPMTVMTIIYRLREDLVNLWEKISYHPEKRYMRGTRDV